MTDALVEQGLRASAVVFSQAKKRLRSNSETIEADDLKEIKRAAVSMNTSFTRYVKLAREREDRLLIELHLLRHAVQRDATDRDANRARVYEMLRKYRIDESPMVQTSLEQVPESGGTSTQPHPASILTSMPSGAQAVDRAMSAVARVEAAIASLSPTGVVHTHGAGLLAAASARRALETSSSHVPPLLPPFS